MYAQDKFRVKGEPGVFCFSTRKAYAKKYGLPDPDENLMSEIDFDDQVRDSSMLIEQTFLQNICGYIHIPPFLKLLHMFSLRESRGSA